MIRKRRCYQIRLIGTFITLGLLSELGEVDGIFTGFGHLRVVS